MKTYNILNTCTFLDDFFEEDNDYLRAEFWRIAKDLNLNINLLTNKPERIRQFLPADWGDGYSNICIGIKLKTDSDNYKIDVLSSIPISKRMICLDYNNMDILNLNDYKEIIREKYNSILIDYPIDEDSMDAHLKGSDCVIWTFNNAEENKLVDFAGKYNFKISWD